MIRDYLAAGMLLHMVTAVELLGLVWIGFVVDTHPFRCLVLVMGSVCCLFTQLDARSRYQEFKRVRDQLRRYGPNNHIFRFLSGSSCRRHAALAAARRVGCRERCTACFKTAGYRWYHLLPDFVADRPEFFFSPAFWRTTFFAPTYRAQDPTRSAAPAAAVRGATGRLTSTPASSIVGA